IEVVTWRPVGSVLEQLSTKLVGGGPHLRKLDVVFSPNDRFLLQTESMGKIKLQLNVILRNFQKFGIEL
ncbi:B9 domain-containing protein 2, partial [Cichlidogyrus casuarinus]